MKPRDVVVLCLIAFLCSCLCSCHSVGSGPISEPVVGIGAALLAAIDQLFAGGVISPEMYKAMHGGVTGIQTAVQGVSDAYEALTTQCAALKTQCVAQQEQLAQQKAQLDGQWSKGEIAGGVGGALTAAAAAAVKINNILRDRHYTPDELADRRIKAIRNKAAKAKAKAQAA